jgi:hypothetical protein
VDGPRVAQERPEPVVTALIRSPFRLGLHVPLCHATMIGHDIAARVQLRTRVHRGMTALFQHGRRIIGEIRAIKAGTPQRVVPRVRPISHERQEER